MELNNKQIKKPMISVIMGIYNCASTLQSALDSLYSQTYQDFEIILCDDGSNDNTYEVALKNAKTHSNVVLLKNPYNMGLNQTLNNCLDVATGHYIARMDGDDLCSPVRFERELAVLEREPDIAIVSTAMQYFDNTGTWGMVSHKEYPTGNDLIDRSQFCHAPCLVRAEAYKAVNGYTVSDRLLRVEDYHLWYKMYKKGFRGKNIQEPLYQMRDDRNAYNRRKFKYRINESYVKFLVFRDFKLPITQFYKVLKPIAVGLLPNALYDMLHKKKLRN